jgi:cytochrome c553
MRILALSSAAILVSVLVACGGKEPEAKAPSGGPTPEATATAATSTEAALPPFDSLSPEQKSARMKKEVLPRMSKVFKDHDAAKYEAFSCKTCHGPSFSPDPHKVLPKLKLSGDGFQKLSAEKPEMVKWMHEAVEPAMAAAMGQKPYDAKTKTGFGCEGCHTVE